MSFDDITDGLLDWLLEGLPDIVGGAFTAMTDYLLSSAAEMLTGILSLILNAISVGFWGNDIVMAMISFSKFCCYGVFAASVVFLIFDVFQEAGAGKAIVWNNVLQGFISGFIFTVFSQALPPLAAEFTGRLMGRISFDFDNDTPLVLAFQDKKITAALGLIMLLVMTAAAIAIFLIFLARQAMVLVHLMSGCFYIPDIVRGDTTKMGDWLRQLVALLATLFFQYLLFFGGASIMLSTLSFGDPQTYIGIALVGGAFGVPKVLQKFGYSSGSRGVLGTVQSVASAGFYLKRM